MSIATSELKEQLVKSGKTLQTVTRLVKAIETLEKDRLNNLQRIEKMVDDLRKVTLSLPLNSEIRQMVEAWLNDCTSHLQSDKSELKRSFGLALENLLKKKGLELKGQYPDLKVGFYTVDVDFDRGQANIWYGPKQELMAKARLAPAEVGKQLEKVEKALAGRQFNEEVFLKRLYGSYLRTVSRIGRKEGEHAPILQVLVDYVFLEQDRRFYSDPRKEHFKGYSRAFFSYDLYRLHQKRLLGKELSLVVATRANTVKRENFLWVPTDDKGNGTVYAYLYFREVT